jgi:hypothetical protein
MGKVYDYSEACEWFLDGAVGGDPECEEHGVGAGDICPSDEMRDAWEEWEGVCGVLWALASAPNARPMPDGWAVDCMHTAEGAGVGIWDGRYEDGTACSPPCDSLQIQRANRVLEGVSSYHRRAEPLSQAYTAFQDSLQNAITAHLESL